MDDIDSSHRTKLAGWLDEKISRLNPIELAAKNSRYACVGGFRAHLNAATSSQLAQLQRKRQESKGAACMAEDSSEFTELRDYIPPGMELRETSSYGRALYATRDFKKFDVVLVETPTLMVTANGSGGATLSDNATREQLFRAWQNQVLVFANADAVSQRRVLMLREAPTDGACIGGAACSPDGIADALRAFVAQDLADVLPESSLHTLKDEDDWRRVPGVFLANACEWDGRGQALPVVASLAAHSCAANLTRVVASPTSSQLELLARRDIQAGELLTLDYLGSKIWSRQERRSALAASKRFLCECARCTRNDQEGSMVCPLCVPLNQRDSGFMLPLLEEGEHPGYVIEQPSAALSASTSLSTSSASDATWVCSGCRREFTREELDTPLPQGAPATTFLGLGKYVVDLVNGLENIQPGELDDESLLQMHTAVLLSVGPRHYTAQLLAMKLLRQSNDIRLVETLMEGIWHWLENVVNLDPVVYLGVAAIIDVSEQLSEFRNQDLAKKYLEAACEGVPKYMHAYKIASAKLFRLCS